MKIVSDIILDKNLKLESAIIDLDNTKLLIISGYNAFSMCGALNIDIYNTPKMKDRHVIAMRSVGVKDINELYNSIILEVTDYAKENGIFPGMRVSEAFKLLSRK